MIRMAFLIVSVTGIASATSPQCAWMCDSPMCDAVCAPVCEPPKCSVTCEQGACAAMPTCTVRVDPPPYTNISTQCPFSETICSPISATMCDASCTHPQIVCEQPSCGWSCSKPASCQQPMCELQCEKPACEMLASTDTGSASVSASGQSSWAAAGAGLGISAFFVALLLGVPVNRQKR